MPAFITFTLPLKLFKAVWKLHPIDLSTATFATDESPAWTAATVELLKVIWFMIGPDGIEELARQARSGKVNFKSIWHWLEWF